MQGAGHKNLKISDYKEFTDLSDRFEAMFKKDFGKPADHEGQYYVYTYAMMPNKIRKIKINNVKADTLFNNCYNMFYDYEIQEPKEVSFSSHNKNITGQHIKSDYLSAITSFTELDKIYILDLKETIKEKVVKGWVMHDLIHELIDAPLDVAGDTFVVALSYYLELSKHFCKDLWSDYRFIIVNSRLISPLLKRNFLEYEEQISSVNKAELTADLVAATKKIMEGKTIKPEYIRDLRNAYNLSAKRRVENLSDFLRGYDRLSA